MSFPVNFKVYHNTDQIQISFLWNFKIAAKIFIENQMWKNNQGNIEMMSMN